ncbi:integrase catalytic domain-containing protein [Trichonephila clavipes]|nr:integrase catalytic domain-containing protein [Trichonephila clavipes]
MSTKHFLLAFRRFISRQGSCGVYSDNAKSFKAASKDLIYFAKILEKSEFKGFISSRGITWKFIVERAPWWGGFYERLVKPVKDPLRKILGKALLTFEELTSMGIKLKYIIERGAWWGGFYERIVRSVKTILRKVIGKSSLTSEELETVLCEIEEVLNLRPLTYIDSDSIGNFPLTPSHFLLAVVVRASDSRPEGLCSMPPNTLRVNTECSLNQRFHGKTMEVEIGGGVIYRPFGEFRRANSYCHLYGAQVLDQRQAYF